MVSKYTLYPDSCSRIQCSLIDNQSLVAWKNRGKVTLSAFCFHVMLVSLTKQKSDIIFWCLYLWQSKNSVSSTNSCWSDNGWGYLSINWFNAGIFLGQIWGRILAPFQLKNEHNLPKWCMIFPISLLYILVKISWKSFADVYFHIMMQIFMRKYKIKCNICYSCTLITCYGI